MPTTPTGTSVVRAINARAALRLLLDHGPLSRPEIAARLAVSKPTASHLLTQLSANGLVRSMGSRDGAIGRAAELFGVNENAAYAAAVDATPWSIRTSIVDLAGAELGSFELLTSDEDTDPVEQVHRALDGAAEAAGIHPSDLHRVVVGIQGAIDPGSDLVRYADHLPNWQRPGLTGALRERIGVPIELENDVNLALIAEHATGTTEEHEDVAVLWVSDGIGLGLMLGGRVHRGLTGGAGEISELPVPGAPVFPDTDEFGASGLQAIAGGAALGRVLAEHGFTAESPAEAAAAAAGAETEAAIAALSEIADRLALGLISVVALVDPELIVLAGDIALAGGERLRTRVQHRLHALTPARPTVRLSVQADPVLKGATRLALERMREELLGAVGGGQPKPTSADD